MLKHNERWNRDFAICGNERMENGRGMRKPWVAVACRVLFHTRTCKSCRGVKVKYVVNERQIDSIELLSVAAGWLPGFLTFKSLLFSMLMSSRSQQLG